MDGKTPTAGVERRKPRRRYGKGRRNGVTFGSLKYLVCVLGLASVASGCSLVSIEDIESPFPENPPYGEIIQEIRIEGNDYTRTWIVEAEMVSQVGEPYTEKSAQSDYLHLGRLGTFTFINFDTEPMDDGIALIVRVKEVSPYIPSLSFALTQENGVEIGPAFSSPNFLGWGARASAYARFGGATNIGVRYWDPWVPGKSWLFGYGFWFIHSERQNELDDFGETTNELFLQVKRNITNDVHPGLRFQFLTVRSDTDGKTLSPDNQDNIPALSLFLEVDKRNAPYPTNGWYAEVEIAKYGILGGDSDYWQFTADVRKYLPLPFGRRHSMALYTLATLTTGVVGTDIPIYMDFQIGGTNTVRGWPLGVVVGKNQWLNTAEYWYRLIDEKAFRFWFIKWRMGMQFSLFGDVGTAWGGEESGRSFSDNFIGGFGGGLRLTIPVVVLLRLDLAYAKDEFGFKIAIGGGEKQTAARKRVR